VVLELGATMPRGRGEKTAGGVASSPESRCAFVFWFFWFVFLAKALLRLRFFSPVLGVTPV
jgi:hypothetical protein